MEKTPEHPIETYIRFQIVIESERRYSRLLKTHQNELRQKAQDCFIGIRSKFPAVKKPAKRGLSKLLAIQQITLGDTGLEPVTFWV